MEMILHSDDFSLQVSDEKGRRYEHFNQGSSQVLYHQSTFQNLIGKIRRKKHQKYFLKNSKILALCI